MTLFGAGYYGESRIPGLVPIAARVPQDTIDPRQSDRTHTALFVASDTWQITDRQQLQFSEYFRTYSLDLRSDFGDGLIRQSEFRTVTGGNTAYTLRVNSAISFEAALDSVAILRGPPSLLMPMRMASFSQSRATTSRSAISLRTPPLMDRFHDSLPMPPASATTLLPSATRTASLRLIPTRLVRD